MRISPRTAVAGFVLSVSLFLGGFVEREISGARRQALRDATVNAENLAQALSADVLDTLETADSTLFVTVDRLENDPGLARSFPQLRQFLIGQTKELTAARSITLYDPDGNWVADSLLTPPMRQPLADRNFLAHIRSHEDRGLHVGTLLRDPATGRFALPVMRRINNRDGSLGGVASLAIDLDFFEGHLESFSFGPKDQLTLYLQDGTVLARHPARTQDVGLSAENGPIFERLPSAPAGSFVAGSVSDDVTRLFAYRRLSDYPLVVSVAVAADEVLAGWRQDAIKTGIIAGTAGLAIIFLGIRLGGEIGRREEAEAALLATERRFIDMADPLPGVLLQWHPQPDGSLRLTYISPGAVSLFGVSLEDLMVDWLNLPFHPEDRPGFVRSMREAVEDETEWSHEGRLIGADGRERWWHGFARPLRTAQGVVYNGFILDCTARKQLEDGLREEGRFREAMLGLTGVALVSFDRLGTFTMVNAAAERLLGYSAAELVGKAAFGTLLAEEELAARAAALKAESGIEVAPGFEAVIHTAAASGHEEREWTLAAKDERRIRTSLSLSAIRDEAGEAVGFAAVLRDLTELRNARSEARRFFRLLENAVEATRDRVLLYDAQDRLVLTNSAFRGIEGKYAGPLELGTPMREILRRFLAAIRKEAEPEAIETLVGEMLAADRRPDAPPVERRLPDGSWSLVRSFPTKEGGALIVATDITALRKAAGELAAARAVAEAADLEKTAFLATLTQEIPTPLNGILGLAQLLDDTPVNDEQKRLTSLLRTEGETLLTLINDIFDISKVEAGRLELEAVTMSPAGVAESAVSIMLPQAAAKGLALRLEIAPTIPRLVVGDPIRLRQILLDLIGNTIKFTGKGQVTVSVACEAEGAEPKSGGQRLRFNVAGTGTGIPPERIPLLFQPFTETDPSMPRRFGGTGLGLAISKRLAEAMQGAIGLENAPGQGSVFWFTVELPVAQTPELRVLSREDGVRPESPFRPARILVAEEAGTSQFVLGTMLTKAGHEVTIVSSGQEAVDAATRQPFDLALMAIEMPGVDGIEASRQIRAREAAAAGTARKLPILAVIANASPEQVAEYRRAGIDGHIAKPIFRADLLAAVARWTAGPPPAGMALPVAVESATRSRI